VLYGDNKKHTVLLVVPEWAEVRSWALATGVAGITIDSSADTLLSEMAVINLLTSEIQSASNVLKSFERPSRFDIILEPFSQENQMMTPKMSVRRQNVLRAYQDKIDGMYSAADTKGYALKIPLSSKHLVDKEE
jgi:long-chain acyl-CoA synthetase